MILFRDEPHCFTAPTVVAADQKVIQGCRWMNSESEPGGAGILHESPSHPWVEWAQPEAESWKGLRKRRWPPSALNLQNRFQGPLDLNGDEARMPQDRGSGMLT
jgi:hypothetical protein